MRRLLIAACLSLGCAPAPPRYTAAPTVVCPPGAGWDGHACVRQLMVTDVRCPPGTAWDGSACAGLHVICPAGARWERGACVADVTPTPPTDELHTPPANVAGVSQDGELFETRGPSAPPDNPQPKDPFQTR